MPESPDFNRLADVCLSRVYEVRAKGLIAEHDVVAEQLRQVWNARGAADVAEAERHDEHPRQLVAHAIRALDA